MQVLHEPVIESHDLHNYPQGKHVLLTVLYFPVSQVTIFSQWPSLFMKWVSVGHLHTSPWITNDLSKHSIQFPLGPEHLLQLDEQFLQ
jgi:hypothetical protein